MKLADYLALHQITPTQFRHMLGVKSRMTVHRYLSGERIPSRKIMEKISRLTDGEVKADDFIDGESLPRCVQNIKPVAGAKNLAKYQGGRRVLYPWSRPCHRTRAQLDDQFEKMMREPLEGYTLSPVIRRAIRVLEGQVTVVDDCHFKLDGRPVEARRLVEKANEILHARGEEQLHYPGVRPLSGTRQVAEKGVLCFQP